MSGWTSFVNEDQHDDTWNDVVDAVPPLSDKLILDLVNGLEVVDDHVRERKRRLGLFWRTWEALGGTSWRRQQHIDETMAGGLRAAAEWLQELDRFQAKTDLGLKAVSNTLARTRARLVRLADRHDELEERVAAALTRLEEQIAAQRDELQRQIDELGLMVRTRDHIDGVFARWEAGRLHRFAPLTQVFIVIETLHWGPLSMHPPDKVAHLYEEIHNRCIAQIRRLYSDRPYDVLVTKTLLSPLRAAPVEHRAMVRFMLSEASPQDHPINSAMAAASSNGKSGGEGTGRTVGEAGGEYAGASEFTHPENLPYVFKADGLAERLMEEAKSRLSLLSLNDG